MIFISLAAVTKITALVLIPPMLIITVLCLDKDSWLDWVKKTVMVGVAALFIPFLWLLRNYFLYGDPFMDYGKMKTQGGLLADSFMDYMSGYPVLDHLYKHFFGLFGWITSDIMQIHGQPYIIYTVIGLLLVLGAYVWISSYFFSRYENKKTSIFIVFAFTLLIPFVFLSHVLPDDLVPRVTFSVLPSLCLFGALLLVMRNVGQEVKLVSYALMVMMFFISVALWKIYLIYITEYRFGAIHGRYFFPLIPFIIMALVSPVVKLIKGRKFPVLVLAIIGLITELTVFLYQVIPFFN